MNTGRLVDVSTSRLAPPEVIEEFRSIDPRVELLYIGRGKWWTGMVYSNIPLIQMGRQALARIQGEGGAPWPALRLCQLKAQGFKAIKLWDLGPDKKWKELCRWPGDPEWGRMLEAFRRQDWIFRHWPNSDASWHRLMLAHELGNETAEESAAVYRALDLAHAERKSFMRLMQGNKLFGYRRAG